MNALTGPFRALDDFLKAHESEIGGAINKIAQSAVRATSAMGEIVVDIKNGDDKDAIRKFADDISYLAKAFLDLYDAKDRFMGQIGLNILNWATGGMVGAPAQAQPTKSTYGGSSEDRLVGNPHAYIARRRARGT